MPSQNKESIGAERLKSPERIVRDLLGGLSGKGPVQDALRWFGFGKKVKPARMGGAWCGTRGVAFWVRKETPKGGGARGAAPAGSKACHIRRYVCGPAPV